MLAREEARKLECSRIWLLLLDKLGDTSALWTETTQSLTPERLRVRAISAYAASSLEAYLSRCTRFVDFLQEVVFERMIPNSTPSRFWFFVCLIFRAGKVMVERIIPNSTPSNPDFVSLLHY